MRSLRTFVVASVLLMGVAALCVEAAGLVVQTDKGIVEGFTSGGVNKWRGVPYATARRFAVPEAYPAWSGVRQTTQPAPICPQLQLIPGIWSGSEDCLYADIYAPQNLTKPAAVLVWIYGGGWIFGDALEFGLYDATNLVKEHNVVVVSFNYRLGPLGFLALKAAKHEDPLGRVGSYGIYDQVFFLQWVQRNIGAFGGDPRQVTIAGESAGAFSTCIHLTSPLSRGLFRAAIMESGTCSSASFFQAQEAGMAWADTFVKTVGCDPSLPDAQMMNCVRKANLTTIMGPDMTRNNTNAGSFMPLLFPMMPWGATIDGVLMRDVPFNVLQSGMGNPVDAVLMGSNLDEGSIFLGRMATVVPQIHTPVQFGDLDTLVDHFFNGNATVRALVNKAYPPSNYGNATDQIEKMMRDFFFLCPTSRAALALTASGVPTFVYQFVYHTEWIESFLGVYHSAELEFVFANEWPPLIHTFSPRDHVMAKTFGFYWQNVVKYGDPNGVKKAEGEQLETEAFWPRYIAKSKQSMALDVPSSVVSGLQEDKCQMWDLIAPWTPPVPHARVAAEAAGMFKRVRRAAKIALE